MAFLSSHNLSGFLRFWGKMVHLNYNICNIYRLFPDWRRTGILACKTELFQVVQSNVVIFLLAYFRRTASCLNQSMISRTRYESKKFSYLHILFLKSYFGLNKMLFFGMVFVLYFFKLSGKSGFQYWSLLSESGIVNPIEISLIEARIFNLGRIPISQFIYFHRK